MTAFAANTNVLDLIGLQDEITEAYINDADVSVTVKTEAGVEVGAVSNWPVTMTYVAGSNGNYRAFLAHTLPFVEGDCYVAHIEADAGTDRVGHWEFKFKVLRRTTR